MAEIKSVLPWVTRNAIMDTYHKRQPEVEQEKETNSLEGCLTLVSSGSHTSESKNKVYDWENEKDISISPITPTICANLRSKGGMAKGETEGGYTSPLITIESSVLLTIKKM